MDNFKAVFRILSSLEAQMDLPQANTEAFCADALGVSEERWKKYIEMMADVGYIRGVSVREYADGGRRINTDAIRITLKGLEYLQENSMMRKVHNALKGIKEITPGI